MKHTCLAIALLVILFTSCIPTPMPPPMYRGLTESTPCTVGLVLDWDERLGPIGCVIHENEGYKVMYYGVQVRSRKKIGILTHAGQFYLTNSVVVKDTTIARGLTGEISITTRVSDSFPFIEVIDKLTVTSDYMQYDTVACDNGYLTTIGPDDDFDFLEPSIKTSEGYITLETKGDGLLSFNAWTEGHGGNKPLSTMQYPAEYGDVVLTTFQVGEQWVDAKVTNCGGGVLGVEYMPR